MAERVTKVRRRRKIRSFANLGDLGEKFQPRQLAVLVAIIILGSGLCFLGLNYGTRVYRNWRESRLLRTASEMLSHDDFDGATRLAQQALELDRDSLPAFQILAEATEKQSKVETVAWRSQIARLLPNRLDSLLNLASAALRFGELDTARKALERVSPNDRDKASYHVVAGWLARAQGDEEGQQEHFAAAVKQEPNNEVYQFNLAVLQIKAADKEKVENARKALERLTKNSQFRTGALRALLNDAVDRSDVTTADSLAQDLQMSPQVTFGDYLLCLNFYRKLDEKRFAAVLDKVKPVAARDPGDLGLLLDWMNNNGLAAEVLKWMEKLPTNVTSIPPAAVSIAEAFSTVKNWSRLRRWTRGGTWGNADYLRLAYEAYAARQVRQAGGDAEFDSLWRSADRAADDELQRELGLARLAMKWNLTVEAEQLWLRVAKNPPARREALDSLVKIYRASNDLPNLYRTMQRLHESSPAEPDVAANYARLGLLLDQNTTEAHQLAKSAYDRTPTDINCAMTYAFSLYVLGRTAEGIEIMKKLPPDQLHDPHAAVYAALLLADENMADPAKDFIDTARRGPIFAEEKKLLEEAAAKVASLAAPSPAPAGSTTASPVPAPPGSASAGAASNQSPNPPRPTPAGTAASTGAASSGTSSASPSPHR
jgi:lipopolysaccharide biosynthesis regulator YciM